MEIEHPHPECNLKFGSDTISLETFSLRTLQASYFKLYIYGWKKGKKRTCRNISALIELVSLFWVMLALPGISKLRSVLYTCCGDAVRRESASLSVDISGIRISAIVSSGAVSGSVVAQVRCHLALCRCSTCYWSPCDHLRAGLRTGYSQVPALAKVYCHSKNENFYQGL